MTQDLQSNEIKSAHRSSLPVTVIRIIVGALFIFSGLIKANDPYGLAFKMQEFFSKWDMTQFNETTYALAVIVIMFEILAGVALLIGYATRLVSVLLIALMVFFLFLTGYAVYFEVKTGVELKCGCFGDCIPLTAWQSFWKDVILLVLTIILLIKRSYIRPLFSRKSGHIFMSIVAAVVGLVIFFAIRNLPYVDCLPLKVGNYMAQLYADKDMSEKVEFEYEFTIDGKKVIKTNEEFMNDPSLHTIPYDRVIEKVIEKTPSHVSVMRDYVMSDPNTGIDFTPSLFNETLDGYFFVWFIKDVNKMNTSNVDRIKAIYDETMKGTQAGLIVVTASPVQEVRQYLQSVQLPVSQIFSMNETSIKTTVRSNPGLLLFNRGKIIGKWSPANYPEGFYFEGELIRFN